MRARLASFLDGKGFTVHQCSNGVEALELCESLQPGVLLMDSTCRCWMVETARRVQAAGSRTWCSSRSAATAQNSRARVEAGFNEFLKTVSASLVLQVIRRTQEMAAVNLKHPN